MDRAEHGKARAGKITGTLAHTVMYGGQQAWDTAINNLWADDGSAFAEATYGARAHGHEFEAVGAAKFWMEHPEFDIRHEPYFDYRGPLMEFRGVVGVSPDRTLYLNGLLSSGLEVKSPTDEETIASHLFNPDNPRSNPHFAQVQHGMLVCHVDHWYQVVHYQEQYFESMVQFDGPWMSRYADRLREFIRQYHGAAPKPKRKLRITDA